MTCIFFFSALHCNSIRSAVGAADGAQPSSLGSFEPAPESSCFLISGQYNYFVLFLKKYCFVFLNVANERIPGYVHFYPFSWAFKFFNFPHIVLFFYLAEVNPSEQSSMAIDTQRGRGGGDDASEHPVAALTTLTMRDQSGEEMFFKVKKGTAMKKIMQAFADRKGVSLEVLRFTIDGTRVNAEDTPKTLKFQDGALIDAHLERRGGGDHSNNLTNSKDGKENAKNYNFSNQFSTVTKFMAFAEAAGTSQVPSIGASAGSSTNTTSTNETNINKPDTTTASTSTTATATRLLPRTAVQGSEPVRAPRPSAKRVFTAPVATAASKKSNATTARKNKSAKAHPVATQVNMGTSNPAVSEQDNLIVEVSEEEETADAPNVSDTHDSSEPHEGTLVSLRTPTDIESETRILNVASGGKYSFVGDTALCAAFMQSIHNGEHADCADLLNTVFVDYAVLEGKNVTVLDYLSASSATEDAIQDALSEIGFAPGSENTFVTMLSRSIVAKLVLTKALLARPNLLMVQMPHKKLPPMEAEWLITFLKKCSCACFLLSADQSVADAVCEHTVHHTAVEFELYDGSPSSFQAFASQRAKGVVATGIAKSTVSSINKLRPKMDRKPTSAKAKVAAVMRKSADTAESVQPKQANKDTDFLSDLLTEFRRNVFSDGEGGSPITFTTDTTATSTVKFNEKQTDHILLTRYNNDIGQVEYEMACMDQSVPHYPIAAKSKEVAEEKKYQVEYMIQQSEEWLEKLVENMSSGEAGRVVKVLNQMKNACNSVDDLNDCPAEVVEKFDMGMLEIKAIVPTKDMATAVLHPLSAAVVAGIVSLLKTRSAKKGLPIARAIADLIKSKKDAAAEKVTALRKALKETDLAISMWEARRKETYDYVPTMLQAVAEFRIKYAHIIKTHYQETQSFLPSNYENLTPYEIVLECRANGGCITLRLAKELKRNKAIHWIRTHPDDVACDSFHIGEKKNFFANYRDLDLVELHALLHQFPEEFKHDPKGEKMKWMVEVSEHVMELTSRAMGDMVKGAYDPQLGCRGWIKNFDLTAHQARRKEYFLPTTEESEAFKVREFFDRETLLERCEGKTTQLFCNSCASF